MNRGLGSSGIVHYLNEQRKYVASGYKIFAAVLPGAGNDELKYIQKVADKYHVESYIVKPSFIELVDDFEKLVWHQEEPFPSSLIYAQYKTFELAKNNNIKVLLDAQGSNEILAGYNKYVHWYLQEMVSRYKFSESKREKLLLKRNNINFRWNIKNIVAAFLPSHASIALEKKEYLRIVHHGEVSKSLLSTLKGREWEGIYKPVVTKLNDILYFSTMQSGLEELLRYSDRNAAAHGCEVRSPFLDARLVQFIFSLPSWCKIKNGYPKYILRKLLNNKLPDDLVWQPGITSNEPPKKQWMESKVMKDYVYEAKAKLVKEDILKPRTLNQKPKLFQAYDADSFDWRYLCVAGILNK